MRTKSSDDYISNRAWLRAAVGGQSLILRGISALEYLELIDGYFGEDEIFVYATSRGQFENVKYFIVESLEQIEYVAIDNVLCSTLNQAVNDLLGDKFSDNHAICKALSNYYFSHNNSFDGLRINSENIESFNFLKDSAIHFYNN